MKTTTDKLLNGRFTFEQPARGHGYRVSVDTLLLAAAVTAQNTEKVLELGSGVGAVMLALATREADIRITGVELQQDLSDLCSHNIALNHFAGRLIALKGDVAKLPDSFKDFYDHVMMNPPFHEEKGHDKSPNQIKAIANTESLDAALSVWIESAYNALKGGGQLTLIHRADRQDEIIECTKQYFSTISIKPIISKQGKDAKRIIMIAKKQKGAGTTTTLKPFILYGEDGRYCSEAEQILREAKPMPL